MSYRGTMLGVALTLLPAFAWILDTSAQTYPIRPIRLIVASSPGSGVDTVGRIVGQRIGEVMGAQVFVDNRAGGGGSIGVQAVAKSAPDGYTLLMAAPSFTINASLMRPPPYDVVRDFAPVGRATTGQYIIVVHPSLPVTSVKELIALARSRPGQLNFGSGGNGNSTHLCAEYFKSLAKIDMTHVPYKGSGPAIVDLLAGQIHLMFANITAGLPQVKAGRLRALATSGDTRSHAAPGIPTVAESGIPGYVVTSWFGVMAPARTPQEIVGKLSGALHGAMRAKDLLEKLAGEGAEPAPTGPAEFGRLVASEVQTWAKVIKTAGLQ